VTQATRIRIGRWLAIILAALSLGFDAAAAAPAPRALILYATTGPWGRWGEIYAIFTANLAGRFGTYDAEPVSAYRPGQIEGHSATFYIGSSYGEPLPAAFLAEAKATRRPLMWIGYGVEALVGTTPGGRYGWSAGSEDTAGQVTSIEYQGERFTRQAKGAGGLIAINIDRPDRAKALAMAHKANGAATPWAVQSGNLFFVSENPYPYMSESDRYLVFADLMFDLLAPDAPRRHRALVRIEDVGPASDPADLRRAADFLAAEHVPFSVAVYDSYRDPLGHDGPRRLDLVQAPQVVAALRYMQARGGELIMHGHTHQLDARRNPYSGVSGDDFEFFTSHVNKAGYVVYDGPVPGDSEAGARARLEEGLAGWRAAGLGRPTLFEFPHYAASAADYRAARGLFAGRYERSYYYAGQLSGRAPDPNTSAGQFFPYPVVDVYGQAVVPEDLGNHEIKGYNHHPPRLPRDILALARRDLVLRDAFASFYHHPFLDIALLKETVRGLKAQGYVFVSAESALANP
jgi:uncharacterized protein YdaL